MILTIIEVTICLKKIPEQWEQVGYTKKYDYN